MKTAAKVLLENIEITDISDKGTGIGRMDNMVVFAEGTVPGDIADVQVFRKKKNYAEGRLERLITSSPDRVSPPCEHFGVCGGCRWQHLNYGKQLFYKQKQVEEVLKRIGKLTNPVIRPIIGSGETYHYRNRLDFSCSDKRWLSPEELKSGEPMQKDVIGFHIPGRFDKILDIQKCLLQEELSNSIRNEVKRFSVETGLKFFNLLNQEGLLRDLIIRSTSTGEWMVIVIFREDQTEKIQVLLEHLAKTFPQINSLQYVINPKRNASIFDLDVKIFRGKDHIMETMEGLRFKISAKSFYQTNSKQAHTLYKVAREMADLKGSELVYDLYTGTGTIANFVAGSAGKVIGIDYIEDAIRDARENSRINHINNTLFFAGDLNKTLNGQFIEENGKPDVIITDPPRSGMHPEAVLKMAEYQPLKIVYISCNPSTQARDISMLNEYYSADAIQPVDMFPQTTHVENVVLLNLRV